jgi:hypothetical protein
MKLELCCVIFMTFTMIKLCFWNCRRRPINVLLLIHNFKRIYSFDVLALTETRICGKATNTIVGKLKFGSNFHVEA